MRMPAQAEVEVNMSDVIRNTIDNLYDRTFQAGLKVFNNVLDYRLPSYIEGAGTVRKAASLLKERGYTSVFVVTDPSLLKIGLPDAMLQSLKDSHISVTLYSGVQPNPTVSNVEEGLKLYLQHKGQAIIAFGGGSVMDCAKAIASRSLHPHRSVLQLQGILKVHRKLPFLIAIPTTAGTGSETTAAAVITDEKTHHKASINDPIIIPAYAILDPELTVGLPPQTTATTGLDALCHAVEAYTNKTYNTELEDELAREAVRLIHENLYTAYQDGSNLKAREEMQRAAFFAGRAFTRGMVGNVHAVGHTLSGLYGMPHGLAMSILLPHVLRQYGSAVYDRLSELADVCGIDGVTKAMKAQNFIRWIEDMKVKMNIPEKTDVIKEEDIPQIIAWAEKEANPLYPVPVIWHKEDYEKLLHRVMVKGKEE
jgi:alcohol dehydrogenase class IV